MYQYSYAKASANRRGRPGWIESENYFRIVHVAPDARNGGPAIVYREQTVKIALGSTGLLRTATSIP